MFNSRANLTESEDANVHNKTQNPDVDRILKELHQRGEQVRERLLLKQKERAIYEAAHQKSHPTTSRSSPSVPRFFPVSPLPTDTQLTSIQLPVAAIYITTPGPKDALKVVLAGKNTDQKEGFINLVVQNEVAKTPSYRSLIGIQFKVIHHAGKTFQLWNPPSQDRFNGITRMYYHGAQIFLVFADTPEEANACLQRLELNPRWGQLLGLSYDLAADGSCKHRLCRLENQSDLLPHVQMATLPTLPERDFDQVVRTLLSHIALVAERKLKLESPSTSSEQMKKSSGKCAIM